MRQKAVKRSRWTRHSVIWASVLLATSAACSQAAEPLEITLQVGERGLPAGPVRSTAAARFKPEAVYTLRAGDAARLLGQADHEGRLWWWSPELGRGTGTIVYQAEPTEKVPGGTGVLVERVGDDTIEVRIEGTLLTCFNFAASEAKPFLWPVIGPTGDPVTRAFPMKRVEGERTDHVHHRSIWTGWGDVRTRDLTKPGTNYWHESRKPEDQDRQVVRKITRTVSGPVFGQIEAQIDWVGHDGRRDFTESRVYTFFRGDADTRVIDVRNTFGFLDSDVVFADTKEAGILSIRIATSMDEITLDRKPGQGRIANSEGQTGMAGCWGRPATWCDFVGPVNGKTVGIAVFDAPGNPGHPPRWHVRDYGLFSVNNFGIKDFPDGNGKDGSHLFKKGHAARFDYRIVIHTGDTQAGRVAERFAVYAETPAKAK